MARNLVPLLVLALAGCLAPSATTDDAPRSDLSTAPVFGRPIEVDIGCRTTCYEPSLARDGAGRLYAVDGAALEIAVSEDEGRTWRTVAPPPVTTPLPTIQADVLLQASPSGRLYYSALLVRTTPTGFLLEGVQVAWTEDGGRSWPVNAQLSPLADPTATVAYADRQWLGFGEGETMVLTYNQIPTGIWLASSTDGGRTWGGWTRVVAVEQRGGGFGQSGAPVVDADGRVLVPACVSTPRNMVAVFVSEDAGRSFQRRDVTASQGCSWFPLLSVAPEGDVVAAWHDRRGGIHVSATTDGARTWTEPKQWGRDSPTSPWPIALGDGRVALAWFEDRDEDVRLHVARGTIADGSTVSLVVANGLDRANTDFAHAILLEDGRLATTWSDFDRKEILLAVET